MHPNVQRRRLTIRAYVAESKAVILPHSEKIGISDFRTWSTVLNAKQTFEGSTGIQVKSSLPGWICLRIDPEMKVKSRVVDFFRSQIADLPDELCEKLSLALDELLGNAIEHGCGVRPKGSVEFTCIRTSRMILFHVKDAGAGFSLDDIPHAALNNPPEEPLRHVEYRCQNGLRPGGFGIMMVKQIADDLMYNEQGNEVVMIKYL